MPAYESRAPGCTAASPKYDSETRRGFSSVIDCARASPTQLSKRPKEAAQTAAKRPHSRERFRLGDMAFVADRSRDRPPAQGLSQDRSMSGRCATEPYKKPLHLPVVNAVIMSVIRRALAEGVASLAVFDAARADRNRKRAKGRGLYMSSHWPNRTRWNPPPLGLAALAMSSVPYTP